MSQHAADRRLVLALYPTTKGFGWTLFEAPLSPLDWGMVKIGPDGNDKLVRRFKRLFLRYRPTVLVLEEYRDNQFRRSDRISRLCTHLADFSAKEGISFVLVRRAVVLATFARYGAKNRYEIGRHIRSQIEALDHVSPRKRRAWDSADMRQSMFDAAALAHVYFAMTKR